LLQFVEDHCNVEDEMDTTELEPENDPEEELLLSGVTFVEPSATKTDDVVPANAPVVETENLPLLLPATPTSTLPLESDESNPAPEATTDNPIPDKPDAAAKKARVQTKAVPKISKKSMELKRVKPRLIMPKVAPKMPIPFISSKRMPKLPPQVKKTSEYPLQEDMNTMNKQIPQKRKMVEQRPHVLLLSDKKKELSKHFVDQLKSILNTVTPRPIYLVPRDSSKSPFLVIPEQLQSGVDKSSQLAGEEKNSECEPTAAKKTRVVELKTGTTYEV
jgi:hypothetical protein